MTITNCRQGDKQLLLCSTITITVYFIWNNITMNENVEMYLVSIARLAELDHAENVPIPALAEELEILPVSANQMIRKLEDAGLVRYLPYKGVHLTEEGRSVANQIQRHHQLWETFLNTCLQFNPQEADSLACKFEHLLSDEEMDHLSAFLSDMSIDHPEHHGQLAQDAPAEKPEIQLAALTVGQSGQVKRITAEQTASSFLSAAGIRPGALLTMLAAADSGQYLVQINNQEMIHLSARVADTIWISEDLSS